MPPDAPTVPRLPAAALPPIAEKSIASPPEWVRDIRIKYTDRAKEWFMQSLALTFAPRRFMEEWATGRREALNPFRFMAFGTAVSFLVDHWGRRILHLAEPNVGRLASHLHTSYGSIGTTFLIGALMHVGFLRRGTPLRSTIAAAGFSGAGPSTLFFIVGWLVSIAMYVGRGSVPLYEAPDVAMPWPVFVTSFPGIVWTILAIAGVHRAGWVRTLLTFIGVIVVLGLVGIAVGVAVVFAAKRLRLG